MNRKIQTALALSLALIPTTWVTPAAAQQGGMGQPSTMHDGMPMQGMMHGGMGQQGMMHDGMPMQGMMCPGMMNGMMGSGMMGRPMMQGGMMGMGGMGMPMARAFDTNGDGQFTPEEIGVGLRTEFTKYDTSSDGALSLDEFQSFYTEMTRMRTVRAFQHADADGDGRITTEEMTFGLPTTP
ncbi:EF-hand domain-containing protein [Paracoccus sp. SY]|uniref:EF-hand domain-containing protein n=1 Tax=Paracoccus sp. SY TaxID=1330255 RepID=UPI000CD27914|nr:EF-hand domain-containing protein [Paracoccus sp. SY]